MLSRSMCRLEDGEHAVIFEEHEHHAHGAADRDNNTPTAIIHLVADAAVSFLVTVGLALARLFGWLWMRDQRTGQQPRWRSVLNTRRGRQ